VSKMLRCPKYDNCKQRYCLTPDRPRTAKRKRSRSFERQPRIHWPVGSHASECGIAGEHTTLDPSPGSAWPPCGVQPLPYNHTADCRTSNRSDPRKNFLRKRGIVRRRVCGKITCVTSKTTPLWQPRVGNIKTWCQSWWMARPSDGSSAALYVRLITDFVMPK
jgi:hypothetical protein